MAKAARLRAAAASGGKAVSTLPRIFSKMESMGTGVQLGAGSKARPRCSLYCFARSSGTGTGLAASSFSFKDCTSAARPLARPSAAMRFFWSCALAPSKPADAASDAEVGAPAATGASLPAFSARHLDCQLFSRHIKTPMAEATKSRLRKERIGEGMGRESLNQRRTLLPSWSVPPGYCQGRVFCGSQLRRGGVLELAVVAPRCRSSISFRVGAAVP